MVGRHGAIWLVYVLGYQFSVGVWVGVIALLGVDAETGTFMLYLDLACDQSMREGRLNSIGELRASGRGAGRRAGA